jgi:hypothetical protein
MGATGATGPQGSTGIVTTTTLSGPDGQTFAGSATVYQFLGPTAEVLTKSQRVTASVTGALSVTIPAGSNIVYGFYFGACYRPWGTSSAPLLLGNPNTVVPNLVRRGIAPSTQGYSATEIAAWSGSYLLPDGDWEVGACAQCLDPQDLLGEYGNGFLLITN